MTQKIRHVLIGVGANVFGMHTAARALETTEWVGFNDIDFVVGRQRAEEYGVPFFTDVPTMLAETRPDVAVVITPHPAHPALSIACLEAGCHVLVEKPMAIDVASADAMIATARRTGKLLAVNFQQRLRPEIIAARKLIQEGRLGKIQNVDMKMTWTRTAIYYRMSTWRGTWVGEGGGVLMNQAPHELDLLYHLLGMPSRVMAWTRTIYHKIETEDTIHAMLEWPDGAMGAVHISTAESGQPQRFEIIGTGGHLAISPGKLVFQQFDMDVRDFIETSDKPFSAPNLIPGEVEIGPGAGNHEAIYRNLHSAILYGTPLAAESESARPSLEIANGMTLSSYTGQPVTFPVDRAEYSALLADLQAGKRR